MRSFGPMASGITNASPAIRRENRPSVGDAGHRVLRRGTPAWTRHTPPTVLRTGSRSTAPGDRHALTTRAACLDGLSSLPMRPPFEDWIGSFDVRHLTSTSLTRASGGSVDTDRGGAYCRTLIGLRVARRDHSRCEHSTNPGETSASLRSLSCSVHHDTSDRRIRPNHLKKGDPRSRRQREMRLGDRQGSACAVKIEPEFHARLVSSRDVVEDVGTDTDPHRRNPQETNRTSRRWSRRCTVEVTCIRAPGPLLVTLGLDVEAPCSTSGELARFSPQSSSDFDFLVAAEIPIWELKMTVVSFMASNPRDVWTQVVALDLQG